MIIVQLMAIAAALYARPEPLPPMSFHRPEVRIGRVTSFDVSERDPGNPDDRLACEHGRRLQPWEFAVASYSLPCGTRIRLLNPRNGLMVEAVVRDRGPVRTRRRPDLQRTDLDLTTAASVAIGFGGSGNLMWWVHENDDERPSAWYDDDPKPYMEIVPPRYFARERPPIPTT